VIRPRLREYTALQWESASYGARGPKIGSSWTRSSPSPAYIARPPSGGCAASVRAGGHCRGDGAVAGQARIGVHRLDFFVPVLLERLQ
jgi:hypothetical protein